MHSRATMHSKQQAEPFDPKTLSSLSSYAARIRYCDRHLTRLKAGTGRRVYDLGDGRVLKLAINEKGRAQNITEGDFGLGQMYPGVINRPIDHCDEDYWVISKRIESVKKTEVADYYGVNWQTLCAYFSASSRYTARRCTSWPDIPPHVVGDGYLDRWESLSRFLMDAEVLADDFAKVSSFGRDPDSGAVVLIDYGLTPQVWREHYARRERGDYGL